MANDISNSNDTIDVRDIIARIEELEADRDGYVSGAPDGGETESPELWAENEPDDANELADLEVLMAELRGNGGDEQWRGDWYPVTLVRDSYFKEYAQELAEDIGAIDSEASWPNNCIDWDKATSELKWDYSSAEFAGVTYWFR